MFTAENAGNHKRSQRPTQRLEKPVTSKAPGPSAWLFDPGALLLAAGLLTAIVMVLISFIFPETAASATVPGRQTSITPSRVREGSLLFTSVKSGQYIPAPQLKIDVTIEITGMVAYARVVQEFENPGNEWLEGIYVFPLPEDAAVNRISLDVGDRVIEGVVKERAEAKKTYTAAKEEGRKASLLEQERPNIFMMTVANIGPGEMIRVELEYQQSVRFDLGVFSLRFPTVVGSRYIPGEQVGPAGRHDEFELSGWAFATPEVADAPRITPPVVEPGEDPVNPISLEVILSPGFNLAKLQSLYHAVDVSHENDGKVIIRLSNEWAVADRDFVLEWEPEQARVPLGTLYAENMAGDNFIHLMVMPPAPNSGNIRQIPREVLFVVDVSGSMNGPSIRQAKEALEFAVSRLTAEDRFNIITFNDRVAKLFKDPMAGTQEHIGSARNFIRRLVAGGGTETAPALYEALDGFTNLDRIRQVIFLTDGCVGNEQALFETVQQRLGDSRIFTVGIGSAPNSFFMRKIAERGRGTFTYIGNVQEVRERMEELYFKLETPLLTDIRLAMDGDPIVEMYPDPIPDLYAGAPLTLVARTKTMPERFILSGYRDGSFWQKEIRAASAGAGQGISTLWARQKIKGLMDSLDGGADKEEVRQNVTATALRHHLVSRYTSLVAVDVTPSRPGYENSNSRMAETNLPRGWQTNKVFGLPQTATVAELCLVLGMIAICLAAVIALLMKRGKSNHA